METNGFWTIYLHGGSFDIPINLGKCRIRDLTFRRAGTSEPDYFGERVIIQNRAAPEIDVEQQSYIEIPREHAIVFHGAGGLTISSHCIMHG